MLDESRVVGVPRIEEVSVSAGTYLFFEFGDDLSGEVELRILVLVEAERERIRCFLVGVEGVDDVLTSDSVAFSVIVELADAGDFVPGFLGTRVVDNDVAVLCPPRLTVFLQFFEPFVLSCSSSQSYSARNLLSARSLFAGRTSRAIPVTVLLRPATRPVT